MARGIALVTLAAAVASAFGGTSAPLIGIFTQPTTSTLCPDGVECEYIASSYVKFVESHGGRAVPIPYGADDETIEALFGSINGVLMPGGDASIPKSATTIYNLALAANDEGDHFPIWGTCNGFEWLVELVTNPVLRERAPPPSPPTRPRAHAPTRPRAHAPTRPRQAGGTLDSGFDSENTTLPLVMTDAAPTSRLFSSMDPTLYARLQDTNLTSALNNHNQGIRPEHFDSQPVADTFTVLSTSLDLNGQAFVSTMVGIQSQWVPCSIAPWLLTPPLHLPGPPHRHRLRHTHTQSAERATDARRRPRNTLSTACSGTPRRTFGSWACPSTARHTRRSRTRSKRSIRLCTLPSNCCSRPGRATTRSLPRRPNQQRSSG